MYILAYLLGSIPFGLIFAKVFAGVDVRKEGSGNIGATNVLRVLKQKDPKLAKKISILTLVGDVLKGVVALLVAKYMGVSEATLWGVAVLAVIGHCFSIFLMFEGGKGVATGLGVLAVLIPKAAVIGLLVWFVSAKTIKISSLSSLLGVVSVFLASFVFYPNIAHSPVAIIVLLIIYKHGPNIAKLLRGEEKRIV
jgi:glycerol-3-phosphate acyltransferase PlsY